MKKIKIGKYYYSILEIIIYSILKWIVVLGGMFIFTILPFYICSLMEKSILLTISIALLDFYLICKMFIENN